MHVLWWSIGSEAMVPNKWKTHLQFSYSYLYEKSLEYFKQLESNNTKKAKKLTTYLAILKIYKKKAMKLQKLLPSLWNFIELLNDHLTNMFCNSKSNFWKWIRKRNFENSSLKLFLEA